MCFPLYLFVPQVCSRAHTVFTVCCVVAQGSIWPDKMGEMGEVLGHTGHLTVHQKACGDLICCHTIVAALWH